MKIWIFYLLWCIKSDCHIFWRIYVQHFELVFIQATSDVQVIGQNVLLITISILPIATILKLMIFKSYSFWVTFFIIEIWKISFVFGKFSERKSWVTIFDMCWIFIQSNCNTFKAELFSRDSDLTTPNVSPCVSPSTNCKNIFKWFIP